MMYMTNGTQKTTISMAKVALRPSRAKDKKRAALTGGALPLRKNLILFYSPKQNCVKLSQLQTMNIYTAKVARPLRASKDSRRGQKSLV